MNPRDWPSVLLTALLQVLRGGHVAEHVSGVIEYFQVVRLLIPRSLSLYVSPCAGRLSSRPATLFLSALHYLLLFCSCSHLHLILPVH